MLKIGYAGRPEDWPKYRGPLHAALSDAGLEAEITPDFDAEAITYLISAPNGPVEDFSVFPKLKAVLNLWAGVEAITANSTITVPLCRMVESGLQEGMVEWVTAHVLRHHLGLDSHIHGQDGVWRGEVMPPLARDRPVVILGLGALGSACARALAGLRFDVHGWSRRARQVAGITTYSGEDGLREILHRAEILVTLLPLTDATRHILNAERLARLPRGAFVINPGRGPLIDDAALLAALDAGQVAHATLDVFETEPLPRDHPYWAHPRVTVTPHIAAFTRPETAARAIAENIRRGEAGAPFLNVVDRGAGY